MEGNCQNNGAETLIAWADYVVFGGMLLLSSAVGVFYVVFSKNKNTSNDFFLGGRKMGCLPTSMSIAASLTNGILLLGFPAELYIFGGQMFVNSFVTFTVAPIVAWMYMPVFRKFSLTSSYEYLHIRFNNSPRCIASGISIVLSVLYSSMSIYAASLALNQVTKWNIYLVIAITFGACILYTSLGGIKAVMWTDTLQAVVIIGAQIAIIVRGSMKVGGWTEVWKRNEDSGRTEFFNMDPDPTTRLTFWTVFVGGTVQYMTFMIGNQGVIQRFLSVPTLRIAQMAIVTGTVSFFISKVMSSYIGLLLFAKYYDCDPVSTKRVGRPDQLVPLFVLDVMGDIPGFPGLFVAGLFSAALSTVSTYLNSMATVTIKDFVTPNWKLTDEKELQLARWLSVVYGLIGFALVFLIEQMGTILQMSWSLIAIAFGSICSIFTLGMFYPWCNSTGALIGPIIGMAFVLWVEVGAQLGRANGLIVYPTKPVSVEGCACNVSSVLPTRLPVKGEVFPLYEVSYLWYSSLCLIVSIVTGLLVSFLTTPQDPRKLDPDLLSPFALWLFEKCPQHLKTKLRLDFKKCRKNRDNTSKSKTRSDLSVSVIEENCAELQRLQS